MLKAKILNTVVIQGFNVFIKNNDISKDKNKKYPTCS
jgi:hypothetical protein